MCCGVILVDSYVPAIVLQAEVRALHLQCQDVPSLRCARCAMVYIFPNSVIWAFYPSLYNMVYTDFIPPKRGVERRIIEDE